MSLPLSYSEGDDAARRAYRGQAAAEVRPENEAPPDAGRRPLLERYRNAGLVREMRGDLPIDEIPRVVHQILEGR